MASIGTTGQRREREDLGEETVEGGGKGYNVSAGNTISANLSKDERWQVSTQNQLVIVHLSALKDRQFQEEDEEDEDWGV